jgi:hypothetical protein
MVWAGTECPVDGLGRHRVPHSVAGGAGEGLVEDIARAWFVVAAVRATHPGRTLRRGGDEGLVTLALADHIAGAQAGLGQACHRGQQSRSLPGFGQ